MLSDILMAAVPMVQCLFWEAIDTDNELYRSYRCGSEHCL